MINSSHDANRVVAELEQRIAALETQLRRAEGERDELARSAGDARRTAEDAVRTRDELFGSVAHDLRNPLNTITMGATALCELATSEPSAQRVRSVAERVQRQAMRMVRIVENLADFAEIQGGRLSLSRTAQRPAAIIAGASELVASFARERAVALEAGAAADLPAVACDAERTMQALANLCTIAIKVSPSGGAIELGARRRGGSVVFFVHDRGPGIARDDQAMMFEPAWHSKHAAYRGAGLGLSVARGIAAAHGGQLEVQSAPGDTTVTLSLSPNGG